MRRLLVALSILLFVPLSSSAWMSPLVCSGAPPGCSDVKKDYYENDDNNLQICTSSYDWHGTQWKATSNYTAIRVDVEMYKATGATGDMYCKIYSDDGGSPGKPNVCLATSTDYQDVSTFTTNTAGEWYPFTFEGLSISSGTIYWIVCTVEGGTVGASVNCRIDYTEPAGLAELCRSTDGSTWTHAYDADMSMRVYACE